MLSNMKQHNLEGSGDGLACYVAPTPYGLVDHSFDTEQGCSGYVIL